MEKAHIKTDTINITLVGEGSLQLAEQLLRKTEVLQSNGKPDGEVESVTFMLTDGRMARFDIVDQGDDWIRFDSHDCLGKSPWNESGTNEGGIAGSDLQGYLTHEMFNLIPENVKKFIISTDRIMDRSKGAIYKTELFIPDASELFGSDGWYADNYPQLEFYKDRRSRIKAAEPGGTDTCDWWTASAASGGAAGAVYVSVSGMSSGYNASAVRGVPVCFRINKADLGGLIREALISGGAVRRREVKS